MEDCLVSQALPCMNIVNSGRLSLVAIFSHMSMTELERARIFRTKSQLMFHTSKQNRGYKGEKGVAGPPGPPGLSPCGGPGWRRVVFLDMKNPAMSVLWDLISQVLCKEDMWTNYLQSV